MPNIASRVVQCAKSAGNGVVSFFEEVIQWRRPVLGSFYVMLTNTAFWASVFYLDKYQQLSCLIGIVIVLFISCVFSTAVVTAAGVVTNAQDSYRKWFSPSEDGNLAERGSVASSVVKTFGVVAFTLESFFLPMINFTTSLLSQRPASIMLIATSSTAARYLHDEQHDKACWSAYLTVLIMILVPPWRYNGVTDQIVTNVSMVYETIRQWLHQHVFSPLVGLILYLFTIIRYCVCGHWIPPLVARMVGIYRGIVDFVHAWFLDPVARLLAYLKSQVIYWACGHWIPPLMEYLKEKKRGMVEWIRVRVVDPIVAVYQSVRDFCIYWFGGYWIPPFCQYCIEKKNQLISAFQRRVVDPIVAFFSDFKNNMKYILLGYWIPPFLAWFRQRVIDRVIHALIECYNTTEYILCGRWIPGLITYLRKKAMETGRYIEIQLSRFKAYVIRRLVQARDYLRESAIRTSNYAKTNWVIPFLSWLKVTRIRLRRWFINSVMIPTWEYTKKQWRRFKFYVKHHVLYPALRRTVYYLLCGIIFAWEHAFMPVFVVISEYAARGKKYAWENWVDPGTEWVIRNLPEKSPLVDDSDTELKDFLPSDEEEDDDELTKVGAEDSEPGDEDESHPIPPSAYSIATSAQAGLARLLAPDIGSSSEEEDEFSAGLHFPAVENADSDEEEEKSMVPRKLSSSSSATTGSYPRRTRPSKRVTAAGVPEEESAGIFPTDPKPRASNSPTAPNRVGQKLADTHPASLEFEPDFEMVEHNDVDD